MNCRRRHSTRRRRRRGRSSSRGPAPSDTCAPASGPRLDPSGDSRDAPGGAGRARPPQRPTQKVEPREVGVAGVAVDRRLQLDHPPDDALGEAEHLESSWPMQATAPRTARAVKGLMRACLAYHGDGVAEVEGGLPGRAHMEPEGASRPRYRGAAGRNPAHPIGSFSTNFTSPSTRATPPSATKEVQPSMAPRRTVSPRTVSPRRGSDWSAITHVDAMTPWSSVDSPKMAAWSFARRRYQESSPRSIGSNA